ncbi:MAG: hypothetical protein II453_17215 [Alphaproteobacteria bacterium]|nr:hypothetical protein [Alphaproteobacteria bacterium]
MKKFQNSFIIYIESERRKKINSFPSPMKGAPPLSPQDSKKNNLKSSENLAIIYIESERESKELMQRSAAQKLRFLAGFGNK